VDLKLYFDTSHITPFSMTHELCGICKSSCHTILTEKLKMHRVDAKFVARLLTEEQKQNSV